MDGAIVGIGALVVVISDDVPWVAAAAMLSVVVVAAAIALPPSSSMSSRHRPPSQIPDETPKHAPELVGYSEVTEQAPHVADDKSHGLDERRQQRQEDADDQCEDPRQVRRDEGRDVRYPPSDVLLLHDR